MRLVVDTNVFISGIFFSGAPHEILQHWRAGKTALVVTAAILEEGRRVGDELAKQFSQVDIEPFLDLLAVHARVVEATSLDEQVCSDPDDDKFFACAIAGRSKIICSGDKSLLKTSGFRGVSVVTPRQFVDKHVREKS